MNDSSMHASDRPDEKNPGNSIPEYSHKDRTTVICLRSSIEVVFIELAFVKDDYEHESASSVPGGPVRRFRQTG